MMGEQAVNELVASIMSDIHKMEQRSQIEKIKQDPKKYKLTTIMSEGKPPTYRYWTAGRDCRGWEIRFCYSSWRNMAGYFLTWREVLPPKKSRAKFVMKRDRWAARKVRKRAAALAKKRCDAWKEKNANH